uniref:Uncharacterized protein n=1 Tax=Panagrolaimus davidi TaxID=227884 RepID=A0A914PPW7_9BILA
MALVEEQISTKISVYGLIYTSVGKFIFSQFEDDSCRSILRTVAAQFQPSHIIYPKGLISSSTQVQLIYGSVDKFTWDIADRSCSVRISRQVGIDGKGYLEDRRPSSNCDPYVVTVAIASAVLLDKENLSQFWI